MGIDKLKRVMWRLRQTYPNRLKISNKELRKTIDVEVGTDPSTYTKARAALLRQEYIERYGNHHVVLKNKDLVNS